MRSHHVLTVLMSVTLLFSCAGCGAQSATEPSETETQLNWYPDKPTDATMTEARKNPTVSEKGPWPLLAVREYKYSFGKMQIEESDVHVFAITNRGESKLEIAVGKPTSNIKNVTLSSDVVEPGETASLRIEWFSGRGTTEQFMHGVEIFTNDPKAPSRQFAIVGSVHSANE